MNKFYFTQEERALMFRVIDKGMLQKPGRDAPQWWVVRLALAKSLQMDEPPDGDEYAPPPYVQGGSELHLDQITGKDKGGSEDYTRPLRLLLSLKHGCDLISNDELFEEVLHRHVRRGLREIKVSWRENFDFFDYLYQDLFFEKPMDSADSPGDRDISDDVLVSALQKIGVQADIDDYSDGLRLSRFRLVLSGVEDYENLRRNIDDLNFILGLSANSITYELGGGERRIVLDIPRPMSTWRYVEWSSASNALAHTSHVLPICPATDVLGTPLTFDLIDAPHVLIGGTTGSGKSICVHAIILSLIECVQDLELVLIDAKAVELTVYEGYSGLQTGRVMSDMADAKTVFQELAKRMDQRQKEYMSLGARDIDEARQKGSKDSRIVVVVDELADLILGNPDVVGPMVRLAQKARAFGIHLVLATQRPEAATFPGLLRSNVPSRIALTVQKNTESRIILDEGGGESLLMRGDMLIRMAGQRTMRAHGVHVSRSHIETVLRHHG